jgi:hypothetical protein
MEISEKIWKRKNYIWRGRDISHHDIPGIGAVSGPADYLIGRRKQSGYSSAQLRSCPGLAVPADRLFVVLETKKAETLTRENSASQLLAQLLTLEFGEL